MALIDDEPITRFTTIEVVPTEDDIVRGKFFGAPQLTQAQINEIPVENLVPGIIVFNTDFDCYMAFVQGSIPDVPGRWCNLNASITYNGLGYEAGSPFALPAGPASVVEASPNNMDPGVMYVNTENSYIPRVYLPGTGWQDLGPGGTPSFANLNLPGNLTVGGTTNLAGNLTVSGLPGNLTVSGTTNLSGNLNIDGTTNLSGNLNVGGNTTVSGTSNFYETVTFASDINAYFGTIYGKRPSGSFNIAPTTSAFNIPSTANPVVIPGTSVASVLNQFTMPQSNRLTYTSSVLTPINVMINAVFYGVYSADAIFTFGIQLNGAPTFGGFSSVQSVTGAAGFSMSSLNIMSLNTGDFIELIVGSPTTTGTVSSAYAATLSIIEI